MYDIAFFVSGVSGTEVIDYTIGTNIVVGISNSAARVLITGGNNRAAGNIRIASAHKDTHAAIGNNCTTGYVQLPLLRMINATGYVPV